MNAPAAAPTAGVAGPAPPLLAVEDLRVHFDTPAGVIRAVDGVSWSLGEGETLGIVGESGSGKSVSALAVLGLLPTPPARYPSGRILYQGRDLVTLDAEEHRRLRGRELAMVFQNPLSALNPVLRVGHQIAEVLQVHERLGRVPARRRAVDLLGEVGLSDPGARAEQYPHQLSGGMRQRAMIAMALALDPKVLLADEPTTALDPTVAAQVLDLLRRLQADRGTALVLISHDLGLVAGCADRVLVMYAGRVAELADAESLYARPRHGYTHGLLRSLPRLDRPRAGRLEAIPGLPPNLAEVPPGCAFHPRCAFAGDECAADPAPVPGGSGAHTVACHHSDLVAAGGGLVLPAQGATTGVGPGRSAPVVAPGSHAPAPAGSLLVVDELTKRYPLPAAGRLLGRGPARVLSAVDGVSFRVEAGTTLAVVGESGSGKSTIARCVLRLTTPTAGSVRFAGREISGLRGGALREMRRQVQVVFQDPYASLNPRMTVARILAEPFRVHGVPADGRVPALLDAVGLGPEHAGRYPGELSGGQRQRVGIARALALEPRLIVCDEPVSALDVSIQAQVLNLLADLQAERGLAYLFIAHDLAVVRHLAQVVAVMHAGRIVETGAAAEVFDRPAHPYTRALLSAVPVPDPRQERARVRIRLVDTPPDGEDRPGGCPFRSRCPRYAHDLDAADRARCQSEAPPLAARGTDHAAACHFGSA